MTADKIRILETILDSEKEVTIEVMDAIKRDVSSKCEKLAAAFEIPRHILCELQEQYSECTPKQFVCHLIRKWQERVGENANIGELAQALIDIEMVHVVYNLAPFV